jgi:hypothetical protein
MSNVLTGDYDAVVEVDVGVVNYILGTLHQKGASEDASPSFLHSFTTRVGDVPKVPKFELAEVFLVQNFGAEAGDIREIPQDVLEDVQEDLLQLRRDLSRVLDPSDSGGGLATVLANIPGLFVVRGTAKVQASTPTITLPQGSTSEVTVHCQIRARYRPDPGTAALPEPIHGEVQATFFVEYNPWGSNGNSVLDVKVTADDAKILFVPAPGTSLTSAEAKQIAREIRRSLRTKFEPMNVELPESFPFRQFKRLGSGSAQAIALPVKLSGKIPAFALDSVTNLFLESGDDFAIAISKDYIGTLLKPALDDLEDFSYSFTVVDVTLPVPWPPFYIEISATYHVSVSSVTVAWQAGAITLTIKGSATTSSVLPNYNFTVTQELTLALNPAGQIVSLQAVGDPSISGNLPGFAKNQAKSQIKKERDEALAKVQQEVQNLTGSISFNDALKEFDASVTSKYTSIEIQPGGVVLRGELTVPERSDGIAYFAETPDGSALTAFKSWIPAGTIEKFIWSWVSPEEVSPDEPAVSPSLPNFGGGIEHKVTRAHSFIFGWHPGGGSPPGAEQPPEPEPKGPPWELYQMCLRIVGTQIDSTTGIATYEGAGAICQVKQPTWIAFGEQWSQWDASIIVPIWGPEPDPEGVLDPAIVAHIDVVTGARLPADGRTNWLLHSL